MAAKWSLKSYNLFIAAARRERPELSVEGARTLYRSMHEKLDRPVFRTDIGKHPRIFSKFAFQAESIQAEKTMEEFFEEMPEEEDLEDGEEWEIGGKADYAKKKK